MNSPPPRAARASGPVFLVHELGERRFQSNLVRRRLLALMRRARSRRRDSGARDHGGLRKRGSWRARGRLAGGGNQGVGSRERQLDLGTTTRKPAPTIRIVSLRLGTNASTTKRLWILHPKISRCIRLGIDPAGNTARSSRASRRDEGLSQSSPVAPLPESDRTGSLYYILYSSCSLRCGHPRASARPSPRIGPPNRSRCPSGGSNSNGSTWRNS